MAKRRYIVELTQAQISFIKHMIYYAEYEMMDGSSFEEGMYGKKLLTEEYSYGKQHIRKANMRDAVYNACDKARDNGLKTIK